MIVVESKADDVARHVANSPDGGPSLGRFVAFAHRSLHDDANYKKIEPVI
jgi:hypothetical protein